MPQANILPSKPFPLAYGPENRVWARIGAFTGFGPSESIGLRRSIRRPSPRLREQAYIRSLPLALTLADIRQAFLRSSTKIYGTESLERFPNFLFSGFLPQINIRFPRVLKIGFFRNFLKSFFSIFFKSFFLKIPFFDFAIFKKKFPEDLPFGFSLKSGLPSLGRPCGLVPRGVPARLRAYARLRADMRAHIRCICMRMRAFNEKLHLDVISNAVLSAVLL